MLLFNDIISGDEMFSDVFNPKEVGGIAYEIDCKMIQNRKGVDVDIGANASTEEAAEELEEGVEIVNNVVDAFQLSGTSFDKKSYMTYIKGYVKNLKKALEAKGASSEEITAFEKGAPVFLKETILAKFKDFEFYTGSSMNPDGMVALLNYREDGITPYLTFWKHGLREEKV